MNVYTVRDLRTTPKSIWEDLPADGVVIITNNGKPTAILIDIANGDFEETMKAVRQAKASAKDYMSDENIEAEITAARQEK